jgi:putative flippase GtrA
MALIRQGMRFVAVGVVLLLIDWLSFVLLTMAGVPVALGNTAARAIAAAVGFWFNGRWTFAHEGQARLGRRRLIRYVLAWSVFTVLSNWMVAAIAVQFSLGYAWLAKPVVEGALAVVSFFTARYWIYR